MHNILNIVIGIVIGIVSLSLMMLLHELGHYVAGRLLGFRIVEFSLFMGPRIFSKVRNGIRYSIKTLPIGASVEFMGEYPNLDPKLNPNRFATEQTDSDEVAAEHGAATIDAGEVETLSQEEILKRDKEAGIFYAQAKWKRFVVMAAGPVMNLLSGILAFFIYFAVVGSSTTLIYQPPAHTMAANAGLQEGDRIISYNSFAVNTDMDMLVAARYPNDHGDAKSIVIQRNDGTGTVETLYLKDSINKFLRLNIVVTKESENFVVLQSSNPALEVGDKLLSINGKKFDGGARIYEGDTAAVTQIDALIEIERDGKQQTVTAPQDIVESKAESGIYLQQERSLGHAFKYACDYTISVIKGSYQLLKLLFRGALKASDALAGPVGIVNIYSTITTAATIVWTEKLLKFLQVFALISLSLGICNFIPLPPLDGSQIFLLGIETLRGKRLSEKAENIYGYIGMALILTLALLTFWVDIMRLFGR